MIFAIVVGKQIYGGLGQNLFNPAMLARVMLLICFPIEMTHWMDPSPIDLSNNQILIPDSWVAFDGVSSATTLSGLMKEPASLFSMIFGEQAGSLGETSALLIILGGLFLLYKRIIHWAIPVSFLLGLGIPAAIGHAVNPEHYLSLETSLFSGGARKFSLGGLG